MPAHVDATGEEKILHNGMKCKIISCPNRKNMTVEFEDGSVKTGVTYGQFSSGHLTKNNIIRANLLNEKKLMNCGMEATVIKYRNSKDIDIQFEDGYIIKHRNASDFKKCKISHPAIKRKRRKEKPIEQNSRLTMVNGERCVVLSDNGADELVVKFDGFNTPMTKIQRKRVQACNLSSNKRNPYQRTKSILGESKKMNCGMSCKVVEDNGADDISVEFEDGTVVLHKKRTAFVSDSILNPNCKMKRNTYGTVLGQKKLMKNGLMAECIADYNSKNITVRFSDGTIVYNIQRGNFIRGNIRKPAQG